MQRDPKGLYEKAKAGTIKNFTGIDSPYEAPEHADITIKTVKATPEDHAQAIVKYLQDKGLSGLEAPKVWRGRADGFIRAARKMPANPQECS